MSLRRWISVVALFVMGSGSALAQPKKGAPPAPAPAEGSGAGSAVEMTEDAPPSDMNGTDENPDAPKGTEEHVVVTAPVVKRPAGYPIEEVLRPITLPENMSEVAIGPHFQVSPYAASDALRGRYGITRQVQLGLTYVTFGVYDDPTNVAKKYAFHPGKALALDVTVLLKNWVGVRVGVPLYFDPFAMSVQLGAPMKFVFDDKLAIGGLEDVVTITAKEFSPSLYQEAANAVGAANKMAGGSQSRGRLRFSGYAEYQQSRQLALIGRLGLDFDDFSANKNAQGYGGGVIFIRAGVLYSVRRYFDLGASLGFDDLAKGGSFGPQINLAVRI
jgi:hypothetical protein